MNVKKVIKKIVNFLLCKRYNAPTNCHFNINCKIKNTQFEGRNMVNGNAVVKTSNIGFGTYIAPDSNINKCKIGRYSLVGFRTLLGAHPLHTVASVHPALYSTRGQYGFTYVTENSFKEYTYADEDEKYAIIIGSDVWVTAGATKIVQGVTIGDGAVVLADAVVTKDVPPYAIVGGVPAKIIGYRFNEEQIRFLLNLKWWDKGEEWIQKHAKYFADIELLMKVVAEENMGVMSSVEVAK